MFLLVIIQKLFYTCYYDPDIQPAPKIWLPNSHVICSFIKHTMSRMSNQRHWRQLAGGPLLSGHSGDSYWRVVCESVYRWFSTIIHSFIHSSIHSFIHPMPFHPSISFHSIHFIPFHPFHSILSIPFHPSIHYNHPLWRWQQLVTLLLCGISISFCPLQTSSVLYTLPRPVLDIIRPLVFRLRWHTCRAALCNLL